MKYCDDDAESMTLSQVSRHADAAIAAALQFAEPPPETVTVASLAPVKKQQSRKNLRVEAALRQGRRTAARKMFSPSFHGKSHTGDALLGRSLKMPFRGANGKVSILDGVVVCKGKSNRGAKCYLCKFDGFESRVFNYPEADVCASLA